MRSHGAVASASLRRSAGAGPQGAGRPGAHLSQDAHLSYNAWQSAHRPLSLLLPPPGTTHERLRMDSDTDLKDLARAAIEAGRVPRARPERLWGSSGDGTDCPICSETIATQDVGFELGPECSVHARCFKAWDVARQESAGVAPTPQLGMAEVR